MRLHTNLSYAHVYEALRQAKVEGHVTWDVEFVNFSAHGSRTMPFAFEIQLGTYDKHSLPAGYTDQNGQKLNVRRYKNTGSRGASSEYYGSCGAVWSATWDEWGWFIAKVFQLDPDAYWAGHYSSSADFHRKTGRKFDDGESTVFPEGATA
jgi:hypothetical protein